MATITYVEACGTARRVDLAPGRNLMEGAREAGVRGILAECGGACACSTCHVYVAPDWVDRLPPPAPHERDMLEFAWQPDPARSRLTCQLIAAEAIDGLVLHVPGQQG